MIKESFTKEHESKQKRRSSSAPLNNLSYRCKSKGQNICGYAGQRMNKVA